MPEKKSEITRETFDHLVELAALELGENEADYLKSSQFFEMEDSTGVYLTKVVEVLNPNEIAPLSYIEPTIRQVLLNRRKMQYLRSLETDLMDEAIRQKEFEIYETTQD